MSRTPGRAAVRGRLIAIGAAALAAAAVTMPAAHAAPASTSGAARIAALQSETRAGTLLQSHGVLDICAAHHAACQAQVVTASPGSTTPLSTTEPVGYGPQDLATAYHLPAASEKDADGTVAIIDAGAYPTLESDLATYRAQYGLPACTTASGCLTIADYHGGPAMPPASTPDTQAEEEYVDYETSLDVDMASAACPGCHIMELQIPLQDGFPATQADEDQATADFGTAVDTAVSMGASSVSMSYGYDSDAATDTGTTAQELDHPGTAIVASSGDGGYSFDYPSWPADLPTVTAAGGTSLLTTNAAGTTFTETAWDGAGSGCAPDLPPADGQPASIAADCGGHRTYSDVSADADPSTGVATYDTYAPSSGAPSDWAVFGGTSAAAPYIAGLYARAGHLTGVVGPNTLYAASKKDFTDVTLGQTEPPAYCQEDSAAPAVCKAGKGWDGPTGLGSPVGLGAF